MTSSFSVELPAGTSNVDCRQQKLRSLGLLAAAALVMLGDPSSFLQSIHVKKIKAAVKTNIKVATYQVHATGTS